MRLGSRTAWDAFFRRLLSPQTARFILALLALGFSGYGAYAMIEVKDEEPGQAAVFAVGQLFALASLAFSYYFGSTARSDERNQKVEIDQPADNPVPVEETTHDPVG